VAGVKMASISHDLRRAALLAPAALLLALPPAGAAEQTAATPTAGRVAGDADPIAADGLAQRVRALTLQALPDAASPRRDAAPRVEVEVGRLDPRLKLAPCRRIEPHLLRGARLWGTTRIGVRCADGPSRWNVYLPLVVRVFARSLVAAVPMPAGAVLSAADLREAEVDIAREPAPVVADAALAIGRTLARPLAAGEELRSTDMRPRQWFAAGDTVRIVASGTGYAVSGQGTALNPGVEGRTVRVRTENGRILTATPVAERHVEVNL
jgi:flagella basal body P-ring formation protein FlgA